MRREYVNSEAHCYKERERGGGKEIEKESSSFKFCSKTVYFGYVRCIIQKTKKGGSGESKFTNLRGGLIKWGKLCSWINID